MNDAPDGLERFIARWQAAGGSERANFQSFVADLCTLLGVPPPDPARISGNVTREIAAHLAGLARSLEGQGHHAEDVAGFLTRCLFTLFAEDVGLLPPRCRPRSSPTATPAT
jgi:hypothetical protein